MKLNDDSLKQNSNRRPKRAAACLTLALVIIACSSVFAFTRRETIKEHWLEAQSTDKLRSLEAQADADALTHFATANRLLKTGESEEAWKSAAQAAKAITDSDSPKLAGRVLALAGYLTAQHGSVRDAETILDSARRSAGNEAMFHVAEGVLASRRKQLVVAVREFKQATDLDASSAEAWSRLAAVLIQGAEPDAALIALRNAARLAPADPQVHADLAEALIRLKMFGEAEKECSRAADLAPDKPQFATLPAVGQAASARSDSEYERAVQMLSSSIKAFPNVDFLHELLAGLHFRFGQYQPARAELQPFLGRNPTDTNGWLNLNAICIKLGDTREAARAFAEYQRRLDVQSAPGTGTTTP